MNKKRILIIGLDGATFDIIRPMVEAGRLPTLAKLMSEGAWGNLQSTVVPITPPAWTSFMTGKNPGKHGVFGFFDQSKGSYKTSTVTGSSIKSKKIWNYCDNERIGLIDIPMTYPPEDINGYMVSGWPVPSDMSVFTSPPEFHTEIISEIGEYMIDETFSSLSQGNPIDALRHLYRYTGMRRDVALYLLGKKGPFDIFAIVFRGTDFIQHEAFKFHDEGYSKANPEICRKFKGVIFQFYEKIDSIVAELIEYMGNDAITIIMSDHGGGPLEKKFYINRWLKKEGFLSLKRRISPKGIHFGKKTLSEIIQRLGVSYLNFFIPSTFRRMRIPYLKPYLKHPISLIDWQKTTAFAYFNRTDGVIRINLEGREPEGIVKQKDYDRVRNEIIEKFMGLVDPETGKSVIQQIYKREDIYHGPYLEDAPDILVLTQNTSHTFSSAIDDGVILEKPKDPAPAPHKMEGIFIIKGPGIKAGQVLSGLNITDVAPTVLYLMGKPIPDSMDGRVISEAIHNEFFRIHPPTYYKEEEGVSFKENIQEFSEEEKKKIEEGLRALGYIE